MQNKLRRGLVLLFFCFPVLAQDQPEPGQPESTAEVATATTVGQEKDGERDIRFQFDGIAYMDVVERFAQMANKPLLAETNVQGTITFNDPRPYNYQEAFETLNTILSMKNVMLVETDRFLRLVPFERLPNMPLKIFRGLDQTGDVSGGEVVTVVMDLKNLDASETAQAISNMLSSAGSVAPLSRGQGLIITDRLGNIRRVQQLLAEIDTSSAAQRQMRAYTLVHASGAVVADLINKTFGAATAPKRTKFNDAKKSFEVLPPDPEDYVTAVFDEASRTLLLFGPGERVGMAEDLIKRFEEGDGARGGEVKIFYPQGTKAEDLARMIRQAIPGVAAENETGSAAATKARVIVDREMNRLIVAAPIAGQLDEIENLVNRIEQSATGEAGVTGAASEEVEITKVIRLQIADPAAAFRVITNAFTRRAPSGNLVPTIKANLDASTKTIVLTGSPGDIQHALGIVEQMENISPTAGPLETAFIDFPSSTELKRVQPLLQQLYANQVLNRPGAAHAKFVPDPEARRLIVTANAEHLEIIRKIADQLRAPAITSQPREFRAIRLENLKVTEALKTITDLVNERMNDDFFRDVPKPLLLPDGPNNRLLITANAAQLEQIEEIVRTVDFAPEKPEREIVNIPLQSLSAAQILPSLNQLLRPIAEAHPDASSRPEIIPDATGKSLIVSAVGEDVEKIREIVRQLEGNNSDGAPRQFRTVKLYNRTPAEIVPLAEQLYREQLKGQPDPSGGPASFVAEPNANRVIVVGSEAEVARAERIIRELDPTMDAAQREETRVIRLKNAVAEEIAGLIEKSINLDVQKVKLLVDSRSNSLVVSGSVEGVESAARMIEQLDELPNSEPREIRVIDLQGGEADTARDILTELLAESMQNLRGKNYQVRARIVADDEANRLIVTGTAAELQEISALMAQIDQPTSETESTRVFKLNSASPREMARVISEAMVSYSRGNQTRRRVTVAPDEQSSSVVVTGSRAALEDVATIIEQLDGPGSLATRQVKIIELKTDEPSALVNLAQQIWNAQTEGRSQDVTITPDPSGHRVIVVAPATVIAQVEQVITGLDQEPDGTARSLQTIELQRRTASAILPTLNRLYEEQSKGSKARPATIVAEASGRRLLVYGSEEQAGAIRELVATLEADVDTAERTTRLFEVGTPEEVARLLPLVQQLYREQMKDNPAADPADAQILADERRGRLIVTGRPEHLTRIEQIIQELSTGKTTERQHETRVYNLNSTTADELVTMVRSVYQEEVKRHPGILNAQALILPDPLSNRLIVSGFTDELEIIDGIVQKLDQVSTQTGNTRTFQLRNAQAQEVAALLSSTLVRWVPNSGRSYPRVTVGIDANNNALIVSGQPADLTAAANIIEKLDSNAAGSNKQLRIFPVSGSSIADFANRLTQLYNEQVKSQPDYGPADALILPDSATDRLIVTASERQLPLIEKLVADLDQLAADGARDLRIFTLEHNSAAAVNPLLREVFSRNLGNTDPGQRLVITAGLEPNALIVEGPKPVLERVSELISQVDAPSSATTGRETKILNLTSTEELERLSPLVQQLYREQLKGQEATNPADAQFLPDTAGARLIVTARTNQLPRIEAILAQLQESPGTPAEPHETRTYNLTSATAEDLAETLTSLYQDKLKASPALRSSRALILPDPVANRLIVSGQPEHLKLIDELVKTLDQVSPQTGGTRVFKLKSARAEQVATLLSNALVDLRNFWRPIPRVSVGVDTNSNSLVVSGAPVDLNAAAAIIEQLDNATELKDRQLRIVPVQTGQAADLAGKVRQLYLDHIINQPGAGPADALIMPDSGADRLILAASESQLAILQNIIATLDNASSAEGREIVIRPLKNNSAGTLAGIISQFFARNVATQDPAQRLVVTASPDDRTLIMEAAGETLTRVNQFTDMLENVEHQRQLQVRSYQVGESRAVDLAPTLARLFSQNNQDDNSRRRNSGRQPDSPGLEPRFEADPAANILLVAATEPQFEEIEKLIEELKATAQVASEIRTFMLTHSDAEEIVPVLASMLRADDPAMQNMRRYQPWRVNNQDPKTVNVAAASAVNAVIVQGPPTALQAAEQIIRSLDNPDSAAKSVIQTVRLTKAVADDVADAVNEALESRGRNRAQRATVTPVMDSNSLIIDGSAEAVQEVLQIVQSLDAESSGGGIEIRVYKLENGKARELSRLLDQTLRSVTSESFRRGGRERSGRRETPVTISADERTNSLIVSATPDQFRMVEQLLLTLDQNAATSDRTVRFVLLKNANALTVSDQLNLLFEDRRNDERPVIEADSFANSLTIIGSRSDIAEIERVIAELDQVSREESIQVRMLVIEAMPAEQLAEMLQGLYAQMSHSEIEIVDKLTPPPAGDTNQPPVQARTTADGKTLVTLAVDRASNALLMSGPAHELDAINKLVDDLTWAALGTEAEFRQFTLKEADPVAVARILTELFKPEPIRVQQREGGQPQVVTPAARMTIVPEPRTRSLIVRGKATDFILLEDLLKQLDTEGVSAQLTPRMVKLEHTDPTKILPLVNELVDQLEDLRPGDPVSLSADPRTRSIFVVARETLVEEVEKVVRSLDTPPAFPEAEIALVALKNTVASQMATILQDMLRPAASGELTPEARELQEQVRSLRIRNENGETVVLDLSQPIKIMADSSPGSRGGNRLILSSTPDNLKALTAVVEMMDTVALVEGVTFKILRLENADAQTTAQTLNTIFQQAQRLTAGPAGPAEPDSETGRALAGPLNISADQRSNSLVLSGKPEAIALAERLVRDLDEEFEGFVTEVRLFRLKFASAARLAPVLQTVFAEAAPIPGTEGLSAQVTRLQTMVDTNNVDNARMTFLPKTRAALTIQADDPSNTLIVAARADVMPLIEDVIQSMDIPAASGMETVRIYPLENADATRLLQVITQIYAARPQMRPEEKPGLTVDTRTNALIVSGNERVFAFIETLISELDKVLPFEYGEFRIVKLENADAEVVANTLQQIIDTRAQQQAALSAVPPQTLRAIIIGDPRTNSLIVGGSNDIFGLVEELARQLDAPGVALSGQIRLIPLEHANAGTISSALNTLFSQRYQSARSADIQRNRPVIIPDPRVNALLVSAGVEDNKALDELLKKLDRKLEDPALSITVIGLKHNDSGQVANMIQNVFNGRLQATTPLGTTPSPQDRVVVSSDPLSNALVVVANGENLEMVRSLVAQIDQEPAVEGGVLQIITLENADATRVASMLRNLVSQGLYRPGLASARGPAARAREALAIAVDSRSNTLIVSASPENLAVVREVVEQIDSSEHGMEGDIRMFQLKHAQASQLSQTLLQFFRQKRAGEMQSGQQDRSIPVTILADDRTNTLLVTGDRDAFDAIERMLAQLDTKDVYDQMNFQVFALKNSTASKLQSTLTRLFQNRPSRISGRPSEPITIVADSWANALIVGASPEDMAMVSGLIQTLDEAQTANGMQVQVIPIQRGDARSIGQTIQGLYRETPGTQPSVRVDVDERINALVVSAGEADLKRIEELVAKLDTTNVARVSEIRIFPLQYAQAEELAQVLRVALTGLPDPTGVSQSPQQQSMLQFIARTPEGEELVASALKESLIITSDQRRNALVISAPVDSMNLIARIIQSLDSQAPQLAKIKVFPLKNADAREMADVLTSLFRLRETPGVPSNQRAIQYTLVRDPSSAGPFSEGEPVTATIGSAEQYALTVTIDLRTNSLLLGGTDHYVGLASHIIEQLDSTPAQERRTEVYRLKNSQATNVVQAIRSFIDQERQRIEAVAAQDAGSPAEVSSVVGNIQQQFERAVAIEAEPLSNSLLLSASPIYFDRFKQLIEELDQPQSQVLIQVILAEVTLDKTSELGVEWTVQARDGNTRFQTGTDFGIARELQQLGGFSSAITGSDVSFLLRALEADGRLEVLSRPQILTADNQEATIDIGQRVPLVTDTRITEQGGIFNSYSYENVGVSLTVTPRISPNGSVQMEVAPEISQLTSSEVQVSPGVNVPIITQRRATTTVSVQNGQSVIIGGLISTTDDTRRRKIPLLGDIPYLGFLFRSSKALSDRKELLIILTPQLLLTPEDARSTTQDQLQRSTIKDEIKRDKLQQEILEPIFPLFDKPQPAETNGVAPIKM